ncbi:MAG: DUF1566 domain-containing protein [Actinobacteria bacterium]|nr:DUF1566 domain-containing protein [Actinomycetota bacterium]
MTTHSKSKSYSRRSAGVLLLVGVLAGVTVGGGVGVIAASSTKSVTVCADTKTNVLRYAKNGKCLKTETKVVLNQTGADGITGAAGAKGDTGAAGTAGAKGDTGTAGAKGDTGAAGAKGDAGVNATLAITQQSVCDGSDADTTANEVCKIGMTGPGGGLIFFVDYNNEYATYDYLEAAPTDGVFASSAATGVWATTTAKCGATAPQATDCQTATIYTEAGVALATIRGLHRGLFGGKAATGVIVARHDAGSVAKNLYAAGVADDYTTATASDWWLPSKDELEKMQENLNNKGVGGFASGGYWSSSEDDAYTAWFQDFGFGLQYSNRKALTYYVRPVRAF